MFANNAAAVITEIVSHAVKFRLFKFTYHTIFVKFHVHISYLGYFISSRSVLDCNESEI